MEGAALTLTIHPGEHLWTPDGRHALGEGGMAEVAQEDVRVTFVTHEAFARASEMLRQERERVFVRCQRQQPRAPRDDRSLFESIRDLEHRIDNVIDRLARLERT